MSQTGQGTIYECYNMKCEAQTQYCSKRSWSWIDRVEDLNCSENIMLYTKLVSTLSIGYLNMEDEEEEEKKEEDDI